MKAAEANALRRAANNFWNALGVSDDAKVIYGGVHKHYPSSNVLAGKPISDRRMEPFAREIIAFRSQLTEGSSKIRRVAPQNYVVSPKGVYYCNSNASLNEKSIVLVGSAKVNPVTEYMIGYQTERFQTREFISADGTWRAKGLFNLFVDEKGEPFTRYDPFQGREWTSFKTNICYTKGNGVGDLCKPEFALGDSTKQVACHFLITRLKSPQPEPNKQKVLIINSAHGYAVSATWQLFRWPQDPVGAFSFYK